MRARPAPVLYSCDSIRRAATEFRGLPEVVDEEVAAGAAVGETTAVPSLQGGALLSGPVSRALLFLAVPVLVEQFLNLLVGLTDTYLAGTVSKEATAAIGLGAMVDWLASLLFGFIGAGATALVSRHAGAGDGRGANHFANQSVSASLVLGAIVAAAVLLGAPMLPRALDWDVRTSQIATLYFHTVSAGYVLLAVTSIASSCWRGMGDTRTPLYIMAMVNAVNIVVSTLLRYGPGPIPELGVRGIVIGTLLARVLGGVLVIALLLRGRSGLRLRRSELRFRAESARRVLRVGVPAGLDGALLWSGQFLFLMIISALAVGAEQAATLAAHFVGIKVEALSYLPAFAWATAASTLVGQSLGARQPGRARRSGHLAALQGSVMCLVMGVIYFVFAPQIYAAFNNNPDLARVSRIGVPALRALAFFQVPLACTIVYTNALRGAGDTRWPLLFSAIGMGLVRLPLAYVGGVVLEGGLLGAWTGMFGDLLLRGILSGVRFARGKWQHIQV